MKWLLFLLLPVVKRVIMLGGEKPASFPVYREGQNTTHVMNGGNLVCHFIQVLFKTGFVSLYVFGTSLDP